MNLSRRDFLGSIACAFAAAAVPCAIPKAAIVERPKPETLTMVDDNPNCATSFMGAWYVEEMKMVVCNPDWLQRT